MFQIYLNNGQIFNVADIYNIPRTALSSQRDAIGLAEGSDVITWIDGNEWIKADWIPHYGGDHPYGWFGMLESVQTKTVHQYYLDKVNQGNLYYFL